MRYHLITDCPDTLTGLRLAGIPGSLVYGATECDAEISRAASDEMVAVLVITAALAQGSRTQIEALKRGDRPLVVVIPGAEASAPTVRQFEKSPEGENYEPH